MSRDRGLPACLLSEIFVPSMASLNGAERGRSRSPKVAHFRLSPFPEHLRTTTDIIMLRAALNDRYFEYPDLLDPFLELIDALLIAMASAAAHTE